MLDATPVAMQRSRGEAAVALETSSRGVVLKGLRQAGSAKAFMPRTDAQIPEVVFLNTSGGLTGGDELNYTVSLGAGARAAAATQTAERGYRALNGAARVQIEIKLADGAHLDWLPQETILFDGASLNRSTRVSLTGSATFLGVEMVVLGRAAMGEVVRDLHLVDRREVWRDGRPFHIEPLRLGSEDIIAGNPAGLGVNSVIASLVYVAPDAEDRLSMIREQLGVAASASAWDGRLVIRACSDDATTLRRAIANAITTLTGRALPRVWQV